MTSKYTSNQVLDLVLDGPADEGDSDDDFEGYVNDEEVITMMSELQQGTNDGMEVECEKECNDESEGESDKEIDSLESSSQDDSNILPEFLRVSSCSSDMTDKSPIDFFHLMVTDNILEHVTEQTKLYADQYLEKRGESELPPKSRLRGWRKKIHTVAKLIQFISLLIIMGIINYPKIGDYWVTSWPYCNDTFSRIMSRDCFSLLMKFFHLNDNKMCIKKGDTGYDPIYKLRPLYEALLKNFKLSYNLGRELSVDESMVSYKGRIWFIQYMPKKPNKWGMKAFVLTDAIAGYTYNWSLYTGMMVYNYMYK